MQILTDLQRTDLKRKISAEMGSLLREVLQDPETVEVMLNGDGSLWQEKQGAECERIGTMSAINAMQLFASIAHSLGEVVNSKNPILEGKLITSGARFEGCIPPIVDAPVFAIRNQATHIFTLESYTESGAITEGQYKALIRGLEARKNILVVGSTGSGKTTFCNALLSKMQAIHPHARIITIEDTPELQISASNSVNLYTSQSKTMRDLLKATMRLRPDKIIVGETRGGEALDLLKAWNTGHNGGVSTVHANNALAGLVRLEELCAEATERPSKNLIAEAVDLSVFITKTPEGRKVTEILSIQGYDKNRETYITEKL